MKVALILMTCSLLFVNQITALTHSSCKNATSWQLGIGSRVRHSSHHITSHHITSHHMTLFHDRVGFDVTAYHCTFILSSYLLFFSVLLSSIGCPMFIWPYLPLPQCLTHTRARINPVRIPGDALRSSEDSPTTPSVWGLCYTYQHAMFANDFIHHFCLVRLGPKVIKGRRKVRASETDELGLGF